MKESAARPDDRVEFVAKIPGTEASWNLLESANKGLVLPAHHVPLFKITNSHAGLRPRQPHIKLLPPLTITQEDCSWIGTSFDSVIASSHKSRRDLVARQDAGR